MENPDTCGCGCCCVHEHEHSHGMSFRRFASRQERKDCLGKYADQLKKEIAGVEERIQEIENS